MSVLRAVISMMFLGLPWAAAASLADDELGKQASWSLPTAAQIREQVDQWLADRQADEVQQTKIELLWSTLQPGDQPPGDTAPERDAPPDMLMAVAESISVLDDRATRLLKQCQGPRRSFSARRFAILEDEKTEPFVRHNLKLLYARWLAQHDLYDEALEQIAELQPDQVVDPAALLFYQGAALHRLLKKEECLDALERLLENENTLPRRYATVAKLMQADMQPLETDSLDEIARLMSDIQRRLQLARAGTRVRKEEDDVIKKLDKMIEKLQQQQQQMMAQANANSNTQRPTRPAQDSVPMGGSGPGDVDQRELDKETDWGDLPPKQRQATLQQITKDLPAHYREVIEEYFRKLARESG